MAQWTGTGSWVSSYVGTLTAVESSYSVDNNSSEVTVSLLLENNAYNRFVGYKVTGSISSDGTVVQSASFTGTMQPNSSGQYHSLDVISSYTFTVPHNADGTKSISLSATITTGTGYGSDNAKIGAGTINITGGTLTLTNIPRASTLNVPSSMTIGTAYSMAITRNSGSFKDSVSWSCLQSGGIVATKTSAASVSITPPTSLYSSMPNTTSATMTVTITTYNGNTAIGSRDYTTTVNIPSSVKPSSPSITLSPVNSNSWLNTKGYYVSGYTKLKVAATASAGTGATLSPLSASVAGQTGTFNSGSNYTTANAISATGTVTATVTASDSRGRSTSNTASVTYVSYTAPSVTTLTAERGTYSDDTWTTSPSGAHIRVTYTVVLTLTGNSIKTGSIACTGQTPQSIAATSGTVYFINTLTSSAYTITLSVQDQVGTTVTKTTSVSTISVPFNFNNVLPAFGIGKLATTARKVESAWNIEIAKEGSTAVVNRVKNDLAAMSMEITSAGRRGLWDTNSGTWMIYKNDDDGITRIARVSNISAVASGQILTSFKEAVAMGSYGTAQSTLAGFVNEVRYSSGAMGSFSLGTAYTLNGVTVPTGWYNFIYSPHRTGGINGAANGDNADYGNLFLMGMNNTNGFFRVRVSTSSIAEVQKMVCAPSEVFASNSVTTSGLSPYQSRCTIQSGGYQIIGKLCIFSMMLKMATTLAGPDYWTVMTGIPTPVRKQALACSADNLKLLMNANVTTAGELQITTSANLVSGNNILISGSYLLS